MFRILGFVIGSLVSLGALVLLVGMPEFHLVEEAPVEERADAPDVLPEREAQTPAVVDLPATPDSMRQSATEAIADGSEAQQPGTRAESTVGAASRRDESTAGRRAAAGCRSRDGCPEDPEPLRTASGPDTAEPDPAEMTAALPIDTVAEPPAESRWRTFWNPFRSRVAAEGFIGRLESVTGLDYRVAKIRIGVYHVQFSYSDDAELDRKLEQISAATGLDLTNRPP